MIKRVSAIYQFFPYILIYIFQTNQYYFKHNILPFHNLKFINNIMLNIKVFEIIIKYVYVIGITLKLFPGFLKIIYFCFLLPIFKKVNITLIIGNTTYLFHQI